MASALYGDHAGLSPLLLLTARAERARRPVERAGLHAQADAAFTEAAACTRNESERAVLHRRAELNLTRVSNSK